jgi:hypothetical protein
MHGGWHHHRDHYGWRRRGLFMALRHIDASPAQERANITEIDKLREKAWQARRAVKDTRGDLSAAIRNPVLDDAALAEVLARVDGATAEMRSAGLEALRNIHALLDDRQRAQVADILEGGWWGHGAHGHGGHCGHGGHRGHHGGHPYRGGGHPYSV